MDVPKQIKSVALVAAFAAFSCLVFAGEDWQAQAIGPFGTLNNRDNSYAISADKAQDLLNVELTPGGKSVKRRKGFGLAYALTITTSPVHGLYNFFDSNGNSIDLAFNDGYMSASANGGTPTVLFSTGSIGASYQCTDSLGYAYCANTSRTALIKTNGATYSKITGFTSTGTMVAACPTRLAMAGFSDAPSRIDFSAETDFTTWGTGSLGTSAAQFTISAPGPKITLIAYAFNRLMWFKNNSFGYILIGNQAAQSDWIIKTVSSDIGTNDNSYVYREGVFYFRGSDGHIYAFDGSNYQRLSREISGTINLAQLRTSNSWTQTSASDFSSGSLTNLDTTSNPGSLQLALTTQTTYQSFVPGNSVGASCQNGTGRTFNVSSATLVQAVKVPVISFGNPSANLTVSILSDSSSNPGSTLTSQTVSATDYIAVGNGFLFVTFPTPIALQTNTFYWIYLQGGNTDGTNALAWWRGASSESSGSYRQRINGGTVSSAVDLQFYLLGSSYTSTGTYLSAVKNAANLTYWDAFSGTTQLNGGTETFSIRASTNVFSVSSSTPSWTTITSGNVPTISTGTYFQIRDVFTTSIATMTPVLNDFTQNWVEGAATDKAYAVYFDDKILWSITYGTGSTTNNRLLVYDLLNQGWLIHDIPANGFLVRQNRLYFGHATSGNVYKYGDVDNDAGAAINAYWKSKDFFWGSPFSSQELANISIVSKSIVNSSMTVTYTTDGQTSGSYSFSSYSASSSFVDKNRNLPQGTVGSSYNIQIGNNAVDQPWEVFGIQVGIRPRSWIPTP